MKFALCSPTVEHADLPALAQRCRNLGYDGVELLHPTSPAAEVRAIFDNAGMQIACISTTARFTQNTQSDSNAADELRACLDSAQHMGCHLVKMAVAQPLKRQSVMATISAMADWLRPFGDLAADRGISIVIENGPTFSTARPLWMLMERLDHPAIGVCWNIDQTLAAGETPAVTLPTLNSRIRFVRMTNEVNQEAISRLKGIGYTGWLGISDQARGLQSLGLSPK